MSSQALVRIGEPLDLYYTDTQNARKQKIRVEYNTRFRSDFSNKSTGVSVFTIPPGHGLRHCLIVIGYNAATINNQTGDRALGRGWGYSAISQVSFRIGGSSQYFLTGAQLLARNMRLCRTKEQRNAMLSLGGAECKVATDFDIDQYAYIPVSVWSSPNDDGINIPLPGDILSQQVQITAQLAPASDFWVSSSGAVGPLPPTAFDTAFFQQEQLVMEDRADSLANKVDLNTHSYGMPLPSFDQQEVQISNLQPTTASQSVVLTGFRAGEVRKLQVWLTKDSNALNRALWYVPSSITALYAGTIFAQYEAGSSRMWNLLDGTAPAAVDQSFLVEATPTTFSSSSVLSEWCELPFAQPTGTDYDGDVLVHGKEITNGIVNLQVSLPTAEAYTMHIVYVYNCTANFSRGTCDLVF